MPDRIISTGAEVDLDAIVAKIVAAYHPTKIYLFGSRAQGTARPDSDVDLLVIYDGAENRWDVASGIYRLFRREQLPLDIVVMSGPAYVKQSRWVNYLAHSVALEGKILYEQGSDRGSLLRNEDISLIAETLELPTDYTVHDPD